MEAPTTSYCPVCTYAPDRAPSPPRAPPPPPPCDVCARISINNSNAQDKGFTFDVAGRCTSVGRYAVDELNGYADLVGADMIQPWTVRSCGGLELQVRRHECNVKAVSSRALGLCCVSRVRFADSEVPWRHTASEEAHQGSPW